MGHLYHTLCLKAQGTLQKREQKIYKSQRSGKVEVNRVIWMRQDHCIREFRDTGIACTMPSSQSRQHSSRNRERTHKPRPHLRCYWQNRRKNQFSLGVWPLVGWPRSSWWPRMPVYVDRTNQICWIMKKKRCREVGSQNWEGDVMMLEEFQKELKDRSWRRK